MALDPITREPVQSPSDGFRMISSTRALDTARGILDRFADVERTLRHLASLYPAEAGVSWATRSLASGAAGISLALLSGAAVWKNCGYERAAHDYLRYAASSQSTGQSFGLHLGWAGILQVARYASAIVQPYDRLCATIEEHLDAITPEVIRADYAAQGSVDLIAGAAGLLIASSGSGERASAMVRYLRGVQQEEMRDMGVAHGVAGVLAALNLSNAELQLRARFARDLMSAAVDTPYGTRFDGYRRADRPFFRVAWCYGTAGCAAVLQDYADFSDDEEAAAMAARSVDTLLHLPDDEWVIWDHGLCHGTIGAATLIHAYAIKAKRNDLQPLVHGLIERALAAFDAALPYGYRSVDPYRQTSYDDPAFLEGAAGIVLGLLAIEAGIDFWLPLLGVTSTRSLEVLL